MEATSEISLKEYWAIIKRWWVMIVSVTVIAALVSGIASEFFIKPTYEESTTLLVNQKATSSQLAMDALYNTIMANESLVQTYSQIMTSNVILNKVIQDLHLTYKPAQLANMISLTSNNQSEVITLDVKANSAVLAANIANTLASVFQKKVVQIMQVSNVQIIDPAVAQANPLPVSPNKKLNVAIAFILGLMVSVGIAFLLEYLDDSVRSEDEAAQILGVPVLGVVPLIHPAAEGKPANALRGSTSAAAQTAAGAVAKKE